MNYILGAENELDEDEIVRGSYLIVVPPAWEDELDDLVEWRSQCGFQVTVATTLETGTSTDDIHDYLDEFYADSDPPLDYVMLVGDVDLPANIETYYMPSGIYDPWVATDHMYTYDLEGDNDLAGFFPGITSAECRWTQPMKHSS